MLNDEDADGIQRSLRWATWGACATIVFAIAAVYAQVTTHEFVNIDDHIYVTENPILEGGWSASSVRMAFRPYAAYWIPLTWLSLLLDWELYGANAPGFLLNNVAMHIAGTILVLLWVRRMQASWGLAMWIGLVFAVHPLHVESVAWVTERKDVLSGMLAFVALHVWTCFVSRPRMSTYIVAVVTYALALMAKPGWMTFPILLLALDAWPRFRPESLSRENILRRIVEKIPFFVLAVAAGVTALATQAAMGGMEQAGRLDFTTRMLNAMHSYGWYLWKAVWPSDLAVIYPLPIDGIPWWQGVLPGLGVLLLGLSVFVLGMQPARRHLWVGGCWFLVPLFPAIGLVHVGIQARADRFMYLPLLGLAIAVGFSVDAWARTRSGRMQRAVLLFGILACAALAWQSERQVGYWRNTTTLFERAIDVTSGNAYAHNRLAEQFKSELRFDDATRHYVETMRIDPSWRTPIIQFANFRQALGDNRTATAMRVAWKKLKSDSGQANLWLGQAWIEAGHYRRARPHLARAVAADSGNVEAQIGLARVLVGLGEPGAALEHLEAVRRIDPRQPDAMAQTAWILATTSDPALRDPERSIAIGSAALAEALGNRALLLDGLAAAYAATGRFNDAVLLAEEAILEAGSLGRPADLGAFRQRREAYRQRLMSIDVPR